MPHWHLLVGSSVLEKHQGGQEPVHALEHRDSPGNVSMDDFQRAAGVKGAVMGHHPAESVGYPGLGVLEPRILPAGTYSVFIEDEGKLYCSIGDGQGGLNPITVKSGEAREVTLVLDHAVY